MTSLLDLTTDNPALKQHNRKSGGYRNSSWSGTDLLLEIRFCSLEPVCCNHGRWAALGCPRGPVYLNVGIVLQTFKLVRSLVSTMHSRGMIQALASGHRAV